MPFLSIGRRRESFQTDRHFLLGGNVKSLVGRDAGQFDIVRGNLFLHHLLERRQGQIFRFVQRHGFAITLFQIGLRSFRAGPNRLGLVSDKGSRRVAKKQLTTVQFVVSGQEEGDAKRTRHASFGIAVAPFPKRQGQIANGLRQRLHAHGFVVIEGVILRLDARVFDQGPSVGHQTGQGGTDIHVHFGNFFHRRRIQQRRTQAFFHRQNATVLGLQPDRGGTEFDGFNGVFDLKQSAFRRKGVDPTIVFGACHIHDDEEGGVGLL
mmetsp:Transcript_21637/g.60046  ORF Transcript_21637/g.60046 Transcript_21637/m.60046 type:complete len:265 (+) Transcript_21637:126-920(+)